MTSLLSDADATLLASLCDEFNRFDPLTPVVTPWSDEMLNRFALPLFARQYHGNEALRGLCDRRHITPETLTSWEQIPAIPTDAFKYTRMSCASEQETVRTFLTSGTTQGARGQHHFASLAPYKASLQKTFKRYALPDMERIRMIILAPSTQDLPESSLSFMLSELVPALGTPDSRFLIKSKQGELKYDLEALYEILDQAENTQQPVMILSTAFALMQLFDSAPERCWSLPEGSRLMETGGFKGRSREVSRQELYALFTRRLGIPSSHCISEYSMTELSSQAYSSHLYDQSVRGIAEVPTEAHYEVAPWVRLQVVDPISLQPLIKANTVGLVRWFDLANTESSMMIQTSDRGHIDDDGRLVLHGRAPDSELRGCSLTIEELMEDA